MSQQNVDLVLGLYPGPAVDLALLAREGLLEDQLFGGGSGLFHPRCECAVVGLRPEETLTCSGLAEIRSLWLEWIAPWQMFRAVVEEAIDLGDRVLVLNDIFRRPGDGEPVVRTTGTDIWTVRDLLVERVEFHADRDAALRAAGVQRERGPDR